MRSYFLFRRMNAIVNKSKKVQFKNKVEFWNNILLCTPLELFRIIHANDVSPDDL